jgi:hypothetical protein
MRTGWFMSSARIFAVEIVELVERVARRAVPQRDVVDAALGEHVEHVVAHAVGGNARQRALQQHRVGAAVGEEQALDLVAVDLRAEGLRDVGLGRQHVDHVAHALPPGQQLPVPRLAKHAEVAVRHAAAVGRKAGGRGGRLGGAGRFMGRRNSRGATLRGSLRQ